MSKYPPQLQPHKRIYAKRASPLSDRQFDLAWKLAMGHTSTRELVRRTGLSPITIKLTLEEACLILDLPGRCALAIWMLQSCGLIGGQS